jgi:predicted RNase H-like HicB family nuclease
MRLTAALRPEAGGYVAQCLEVDVASQGQTIESALANLKEALELYFEDVQTSSAEPTPIIVPIDIETPG